MLNLLASSTDSSPLRVCLSHLIIYASRVVSLAYTRLNFDVDAREQDIIDHTKRTTYDKQRPAWDSSWNTEAARQAEENVEQASGFLSDFAGVGVCGVKPFNRSGKHKTGEASSAAPKLG